jgi:uncharacterized small protein (DUF1192 family)
MSTAEQHEQDCRDAVRGFVLSHQAGAQAILRKRRREQAAAGQAPAPLIEAAAQSTTHETLVLHAEAMAGVLEELSERVHLLREELWRLRAELAQQGGER